MEEEAIKQLMTIDGVGKAKAKLLYDAGFDTIGSIKKAELEEIAGIKGIGEKLATKIKNSADEIVIEVEEKTAEKIEVPQVTLAIDDNTKRLLNVRKKQKSKKPKFLQTDSHKKKKLEDKWKKPDGIHNKMRYHVKGKGPRVNAGYGSPALVRGLHPSGSIKVEKQAARIAHTVGERKRNLIEKRAAELGLKILNPTRREE
ncbi:MAG: 50S ribosomal protein L32e [Candidatus Methanoperedens sp.]|nr:50S ribosomal protein L32e [Candidatus Methanoperedens sp.]